MAMARLVDTPQTRKQSMVQIRPTRMMGFRPKRSEARPQGTAVTLWDKEKTAPVRPAQKGTSSSTTPKLATISGR